METNEEIIYLLQWSMKAEMRYSLKKKIKVVPREILALWYCLFYFEQMKGRSKMLDKKYNHLEVEKDR